MQVHDMAVHRYNLIAPAHGNETALHAAYRIGSEAKIDLLLKFGARSDCQWMGESPKDLCIKYKLQSKSCYKLDPCSSQNDESLALEQVVNCRAFMKCDETKNIVKNVCKCVELVTKRVSNVPQLELQTSLSGSFAENTKCFAPDEFDFTN